MTARSPTRPDSRTQLIRRGADAEVTAAPQAVRHRARRDELLRGGDENTAPR
jgi:hypothetical protein